MPRGLGRGGGVEGSPDPLGTGHVLLRFGANDGIGLLVLAVYTRMKRCEIKLKTGACGMIGKNTFEASNEELKGSNVELQGLLVILCLILGHSCVEVSYPLREEGGRHLAVLW